MTATFTELRKASVPINRSCALLGRARDTHYRHARGPVHGPRPARLVPENGQALSLTERAAVLRLINTPAYADLAIGQIWARELDEGRYWCSASSMYHIARDSGRAAETNPWQKCAESARAMICPATPARRLVLIAWVNNLP
ncbi:MAG: hypothetical protein ABIR34_04330, partial [Marmoricola sp.]